MPPHGNIETYTNPIEGLKPDDRGYEAYQLEGRHIEASYGQISQSLHQLGSEGQQFYDQHVTAEQSLAGDAWRSQYVLQKTEALKQQLAQDAKNPFSDPHLADKAVQEFQAGLTDYTNTNFSSREARQRAQEENIRAVQSFQSTAMSGQAVVTSMNMEQNFNRTSESSVALATGTPALVDQAIAQIKSNFNVTLDQYGGAMGPEGVAHLKENMAQQQGIAVQAAARTAMDQAQLGQENTALHQFLTAHPDARTMLKPEDEDSLGKYADTAMRFHQEQQRSADLNQKTQMEAAGKQTYAQIRNAAFNPATGDYNWTPDLIKQLRQANMTYAQYDSGEGASLLNTVREANDRLESGKDVQTNWNAYDKLAADAAAGTASQVEIDRAFNAKQLSTDRYHLLSSMADQAKKDPTTAEMWKRANAFIETEKGTILGANPGRATAAAHTAYFALDNAVRSGIEAGIKSGQTPQQVMDTALNPADKSHYFGYDQGIMGNIKQMVGHLNKMSMQQAHATAQGQPTTGAAPAAKPANAWDGKESMAQYAGRLQGGQ